MSSSASLRMATPPPKAPALKLQPPPGALACPALYHSSFMEAQSDLLLMLMHSVLFSDSWHACPTPCSRRRENMPL